MKKSDGIGLCGILTITFVLLKLFNAIDWSWWWVFSPLWIPWAIVLGFVTLCLIFAGFIFTGSMALLILSAFIGRK